MQFVKSGDIYKVIRTTGSQDNILGIFFGKEDIEVIEWHFNNGNQKKPGTSNSKEEVLKQVLLGLESVNKSFGTNYTLSKIYFSPLDNPVNRVYSGLTAILIRHYHNGNEFTNY